ncbi:MAG: hypothetical protein C4293_18755 [Nitrospiraceae bacterium]
MDLFALGVDVIRMAVGLVFLVSVLSKLRDLRGFLKGIIAYQVLPSRLAVIYGLLLLPLEGFVAVSLLSRWELQLGTVVAIVLLLSFAAAVALNLRWGRDLPCYCFGSRSTEQVSARSLVRIGLLIVGATSVLVGELSHLPIQVEIFSWEANLWKGTLALFTLIVGMWLLTLPDLRSLWHRGEGGTSSG